MTSMTRVFKIKKKSNFFIVILVPFEIISHYPNIDSSNWLMEDVQRHLKSLQRNANHLNVFDFSTEFLVFAGTCHCFHNHGTYCDVFLMTF